MGEVAWDRMVEELYARYGQLVDDLSFRDDPRSPLDKEYCDSSDHESVSDSESDTDDDL